MKLGNGLEIIGEPFTFSMDKNPLKELIKESLIEKGYLEEDINKLFNTSYKEVLFSEEDQKKLGCKNLREIEEILGINFDDISKDY